jgi:RIO kinase 1
VEERDRFLRKDRTGAAAVLEEVFDHQTLTTIYELMNQGALERLEGVVSAGKESRVYSGVDADGNYVAVKIYLTTSAEFKRGMLPYLEGDPRFRRIKHDTRSLIYSWAQKEFKNLKLAHDAGVRVPKPMLVKRNVLIMEFIGREGVPAPLLKDTPIRDQAKLYLSLIGAVCKLYTKARLIHADLSEYNVMIWRGKPVIFDLSQGVTIEHPMAERFLKRDLENLNRYFKLLGVNVIPVDKAYEQVVKGDRGSNIR